MPNVTIIGAGLGGSLLGIYLARRCWNVHLYELRGNLRREPVEPGRSIKLTLAERGLVAADRRRHRDDVPHPFR